MAGCRSQRAPSAPVPLALPDNTTEGTVVGDDRTAMEAAIDVGPTSASMPNGDSSHGSGPVLAPNAPDSYVVKRGDTLWGIAKVFLRDPWYWPEIWQVNSQIQNPHLIYPGDTLRLVYIDGRPRVTVSRGLAERGDLARVEPRVRSQPLEAAVTTIPYETVAAFMSKPSVLSSEQIKGAPYVLASKDTHVIISDGDTLSSATPRCRARITTSSASATRCAIPTTTGSSAMTGFSPRRATSHAPATRPPWS